MRQIVGQLKELDLLEGADEGGLTMICLNYDLLLSAREEIAVDGITTTNSKGIVVPSPAVSVAMQAQTQLIKLLREYGLTSKARATLKKYDPPEPEKSPLSRFLEDNG